MTRAGSRKKFSSQVATIVGAFLGVMIAPAITGAAKSATFGANVGGLFPVNQPVAANATSALQALRATAATVARTDSFWGTAEPQPPVNGTHSYDWTYDDAIALTLASAGLRWQPIVDYAAWWAGDSGGGANPGVSPSHVADYTAYAGAFAARYGVGGVFWTQHPSLARYAVNVFEIWNEPDLFAYWGPAPDLAEYASMFLGARSAIDAADPEAAVIIGGLIDPSASLPAMLAARPDLRGAVDGLAVHAYASDAPGTLATVTAELRADAAYLGVPLYVNEYGWQTVPTGWQAATEQSRDENIEQVTEQLGQNPLIDDVEAYCWVCSGAFTMYGTPAATAFAQGIAASQISGTRPVAITGRTSRVHAARAMLNGEINPEHTAATYHFDYGTSTAYGSRVPSSDAVVGSDSSNHPVSQTIAGLLPSTTYHYRLVATNTTGTSYGADRTFTTKSPPAPVASVRAKVGTLGTILKFTFACQGVGGQVCQGHATATAIEKLSANGKTITGVLAANSRSGRYRVVTILTGNPSVAAGQGKDVSIGLNLTGRMLRNKFKNVPCDVKITATAVGATTAIRTAKVTFGPDPPTVNIAGTPATKHSSATVGLRCRGLSTRVCRGAVQLTTFEKLSANGRTITGLTSTPSGKGGLVTIASGGWSIEAGHTLRLVIGLNPPGKSLLAKFGKLPATLKITPTSNGYSLHPTNVTITFKR